MYKQNELSLEKTQWKIGHGIRTPRIGSFANHGQKRPGMENNYMLGIRSKRESGLKHVCFGNHSSM